MRMEKKTLSQQPISKPDERSRNDLRGAMTRKGKAKSKWLALLTALFMILFAQSLGAQDKAVHTIPGADSSRWDIAGHHAVQWDGKRGGLPHQDHVEMAGRQVAVVYYWDVDAQGRFHVNRHMIFPSLRRLPNNTHASWMPRENADFVDGTLLNGRSLEQETVQQVRLDGMLTIKSEWKNSKGRMSLVRQLWPSTSLPMTLESYTWTNLSETEVELHLPSLYVRRTTNPERGLTGSYNLVAKSGQADMDVKLKPGNQITVYASVQGFDIKSGKELDPDFSRELQARQAFVEHVTASLDFHCPNDTINTLFALSKIRGSESIFDTPSGPMHGPGGESYYAAMWCNDQAEYINPFFPFLGYPLGNQSAMTTWEAYLKLINPEYKFLPWSIICGGSDTFGPFDRGDAAMLAYGAGRYCLERSDKDEALKVWPLIEWCLEYCHRRLNQEGVVASEGDELEHRLPCGDANLCTSSLYYDALLSAAYLGRELGKNKGQMALYEQQARALRGNIDRYFHAEVEGYDTYRYYAGNDKLRSWICIPLTMGIYERSAGTIKAMFSPQLWTENGMLSISGDRIFWDRSTLYGLRGTFAAGYPDIAAEYMHKFSAIRLLGEHVPYVIEAWPEGGQRHLSAENGLYCRIITEGLLGFRPTGFRSFSLTPQMPTAWDTYSLSDIHACTDSPLSIDVTRVGSALRVRILKNGRVVTQRKVKAGNKIEVSI